MHDHTYHGCSHILKHCTHCDVVYCTKCKKEWSTHSCIPDQWKPYWTTTSSNGRVMNYGDFDHIMKAADDLAGGIATAFAGSGCSCNHEIK